MKPAPQTTAAPRFYLGEQEHTPVLIGAGLEREQMRSSMKISRTGYVLLILLAIALFSSVFALAARAFDIGEYQRQIERV